MKPSENPRKSETMVREALTYVNSILDTVREPLLVVDGELRIRSTSRAFLHTFAVSREDSEGQYIYDLGNGQWDIPALRTLLEEVLPKSRQLRDFEVVHDFPVLGRRVMILNARKLWTEEDDIELVLVAFEDVTERKRVEEELLRSNEELQRFAYVAAHDLRSPLNSALHLTELCARRVKGKLDKAEYELLMQSISSMQRLNALMNDLLTYSEAGNAPIEAIPLSLEEPLNIALENLQHHINRTGAEITVGALPKALADRTQMVMVFQNLIGNAIKYRSAETPLIHIKAVQKDSYWRISVSDNGKGFDPVYTSVIFEPFKRLHGPSVPGRHWPCDM